MRTRIWKVAGRFACYGQALEVHYRADDGELCPECEEVLVAVAADKLPDFGRHAIAEPCRCTVTCRHERASKAVDFTIAPAGEMVVLADDYPEAVVLGFLASVDLGARWLSRIH